MEMPSKMGKRNKTKLCFAPSSSSLLPSSTAFIYTNHDDKVIIMLIIIYNSESEYKMNEHNSFAVIAYTAWENKAAAEERKNPTTSIFL